jgi:hypothetical protein
VVCWIHKGLDGELFKNDYIRVLGLLYASKHLAYADLDKIVGDIQNSAMWIQSTRYYRPDRVLPFADRVALVVRSGIINYALDSASHV